MTNPNEIKFSKETEEMWHKLLVFKKKYKECSNQVKSLEEALAVGNLELSLTTKECARLKEDVRAKQTSITKYQQILKEQVEIEDRYCQLLQEKKNTDEELAAEKKLRLDLEKRHEEEKNEIRQSLEEELRILKADAKVKEDTTFVEYSQTIEEKDKEIVTLKHKLSEYVKKVGLNCSIGNQTEKTDSSTNKGHSVVERSQALTNPMALNSPLKNKKVINPLDVSRLPTRCPKKSPVRKKRKLYSRSDDLLW